MEDHNKNISEEVLPHDFPPDDFQISTSESVNSYDSYEKSLNPFENRVKCSLCFKLKKNFLCPECLLKGSFTYSKQSNKSNVLRDSYVDKKLKLLSLNLKKNELIAECEKYTMVKDKISRIKEEMHNCKMTIGIQNELKNSIQKNILKLNSESDVLELDYKKKNCKFPLYRKRLDNMEAQYKHNQNQLEKYQKVVNTKKNRLKEVSKSCIIKLRDTVFPIIRNDPNPANKFSHENWKNLGDSWSDEEDETVRSLMAATSTSWGRPDDLMSTFGLCYSITGPYTTAPSLPATGDYSAYNIWINKNQGGTLSSGGQTRNPANTLASALTYTTQFVNLLAYFLDLRLPHRLSFSEFTNGNLTGGKFNRKVAKLNANVIHLCASQGIPPSLLQPRHTISNLLLLFDFEVSDLGRREPFEVASQLAKSMEDSIEKDLVIYEENSDSENDWCDSNFPSDWENVQRGTISDEISLQSLMNQTTLQSIDFQSFQNQSDYFLRSRTTTNNNVGLLSSFSSFFKGWGK